MNKTILAIQSVLPAEMEALEQHFTVIRLWEQRDPEAVIRDHSNDVVGVLSTYDSRGVSARLIEALPNLEIIAQYGVGYDNIDVAAAAARGIAVTNTPDVVTDDTADMALFLMLATARRAVEADMCVRVGRWQSSIPYMGASLSGKTVGIFGLGKIGNAIARRAEAFNTRVIYHSRTKKDGALYDYCESLEELARQSDFLVLACAGGLGTKHAVNYKILEALGPKGYLVNIARGSVVDEDDLLIALRNRAIAGAGLDVFAHEPAVPEEMKKMDNVVLSPHVGGGTFETRSKMGQLVVQSFLAHFSGKPLLTPVGK